ncbi:MAG: chorismate mutase [Candidatus Dormibacteraceae bacterium]
MPVRGIRGATTAAANTPEAILGATAEMLQALVAANDIDPAEIACAFLTTTPDLDAEFPAAAARGLGWDRVALLCGHDMNVTAPNPRAVARCIRVLVLYNTSRPQSAFSAVYLREAERIRVEIERERVEPRP